LSTVESKIKFMINQTEEGHLHRSTMRTEHVK